MRTVAEKSARNPPLTDKERYERRKARRAAEKAAAATKIGDTEKTSPTEIDPPEKTSPGPKLAPITPVDRSVRVAWSPRGNPAQVSLLACPVFEVFFGGARGGGKTDGVLGEFGAHASRYGDHAIGLMVRRTRAELVETIERSREIYGILGWKFNETEKMWRAPNGARLRFAYLERDHDADLYQGHSYTRVYVEEAGNFPSPAPILKLMATLRSGAGVPVGMRATGNPGGPGHQWVKSRYIDPWPTGNKVFTDPVTKLQRVFIPSRVENNVYIDVEDYKNRLRASGSKELVRAWLDGDWTVTLGAFFDCWEAKRHIIEPFPIPDGWLRFRSMDWGSASPFSVGWWAIVQDDINVRGRLLKRGCLVRYREWYGCRSGEPNVGIKMHAEEVGRGIWEREEHDKVAYGVLDPSAFAEEGGPSIAERIASGSGGKVWFRHADNKRVAMRGAMGGWDQMRARLVGDSEGHPMIVTFSHCVDSIRTVPFLQHDPDRPEDVMTESEDHCFAAGTLVETDLGPRAIETLVGTVGSVLTGKDRYDFYRSARMTRQNADVIRLSFDNGRTVVCTKDHRFLDSRGEWCYASNLWGRSVKCIPSSSVQPFRSSTGAAIISAANIFSTKAANCILRCGNIITDPSQKAINFIIATMAAATMRLKTSNASMWSLTWAVGTVPKAENVAGNFCHWHSLPRGRGTEAPKGESGIRRILSNASARFWSGEFPQSAKSAARNTSSPPRGLHRANSAARIAGLARCVSVESAGQSDVYCITVPSRGFFAIEGGMIVANCGDEWRYACMSRPWVPVIEPVKQEVQTGYKKVSELYQQAGDWRAY